jgi:hypothetical protein
MVEMVVREVVELGIESITSQVQAQQIKDFKEEFPFGEVMEVVAGVEAQVVWE